MKSLFVTSNKYSKELKKLSSLKNKLKEDKYNKEANELFIKAGIFTKQNKLTETYSVLNHFDFNHDK